MRLMFVLARRKGEGWVKLYRCPEAWPLEEMAARLGREYSVMKERIK